MSDHAMVMVDRVEPGEPLQHGEAEPVLIETWPAGAAILTLDDGTRLMLDPDTREALARELSDAHQVERRAA